MQPNPLTHLNKRPRPPLTEKRYRLPTGQVLPSELECVRAMHAKNTPALTLAEFVSAAWPILEPSTPLEWNWHLDVICAHAQALVTDQPGVYGATCPQNLLMNVPPGTMKSLVTSVFLPAWVWLWRPSWRAVFASGTPSVVTRDSLKCRNLIKSDWYQSTFEPKWKISADQDEKQHFANTSGGFRKGVGAGGAVTGERADFLAVDDPNDAQEIHSKAHREQINDKWWTNAFHNRIADPSKSKRMIIMQRLHEEDLAGYVLEKEKGQWAHLVMQMEFELSDERPGDKKTWIGWSDPRTEEGQLLFPQRFTEEYCAKEKVALGSSGYAGQNQQRPVSAAGNRYKREWWRFWSPSGSIGTRPKGANAFPPIQFDPARDRIDLTIGSWDMTFKDTDGSDYVVGVVVAVQGARRFVLERTRARMGFPETRRAVKRQRDEHRPDEILIEDKANGPAVIKDLEAEVPGIIAVNPEGGKEARSAIMEPKVEAGNWYLPEGAPWLDEWVDEFAAFPKGRNDDQVDAATQVEARLTDDVETWTARKLLGLG